LQGQDKSGQRERLLAERIGLDLSACGLECVEADSERLWLHRKLLRGRADALAFSCDAPGWVEWTT